MEFSANELKFILICVKQANFDDTKNIRNQSWLNIKLCDEIERRTKEEQGQSQEVMDAKVNGAEEPEQEHPVEH